MELKASGRLREDSKTPDAPIKAMYRMLNMLWLICDLIRSRYHLRCNEVEVLVLFPEFAKLPWDDVEGEQLKRRMQHVFFNPCNADWFRV